MISPRTSSSSLEGLLARYAADPQIAIYRTDEHGNVTVRSDGAAMWLATAR